MTINPLTLPQIKDLEACFFEAMAVGYASIAPKVAPHPTLEGWKINTVEGTWRSDILVITDEWCDTGGRTLISLRRDSGESVALWCMRYWGTYSKKEVPFLKQAASPVCRLWKERVHWRSWTH